MKAISKAFIRFYQKYISILSYGSCRYYPTCSQYALWQLDNNGFFKSIFYTILRILKCNQLFDGGFDYPVVKGALKFKNIKYKKIKVIYWYVPLKNNRYLVVKNREWKRDNE
ncbi:putative membrane protein insertion efficiency factor [Aliarcobacter thereius]|uniref:Putative membrane protein insertion efficiency factor n=2 Tax=Aliarcobacter thereius TaxID=544718 RepID=A0A1C0B623_9BACT|nr:membrane protein insertion efficiency factor YidD [Aliarcobacter thereius]OCL85783.1 putative membrane protein insertion efficiency factor [Aliarcobacter thereius]OCL89786.1 putative membrane protein insertion efficiency factor [Aliarcobacter thereius]OCL96436.1 putative membrane protein insertion efficiency factor [Aliarcobacter thereius LMG 24486]OCL98602.1 putative membrane protein insertion efficiency factor [Aliarcobacter thereius]QBF15602.1 membrane protein insertion efficiency factor